MSSFSVPHGICPCGLPRGQFPFKPWQSSSMADVTGWTGYWHRVGRSVLTLPQPLPLPLPGLFDFIMYHLGSCNSQTAVVILLGIVLFFCSWSTHPLHLHIWPLWPQWLCLVPWSSSTGPSSWWNELPCTCESKSSQGSWAPRWPLVASYPSQEESTQSTWSLPKQLVVETYYVGTTSGDNEVINYLQA